MGVMIALGRLEVKIAFALRDGDGKLSLKVASGTAAVPFCPNIEALEISELVQL
jgi:hypothetical protein